ncbi:tripartite tricarboxylate transporter TctB family protein [Rhodovibrio salinarum]|uniref:DUF1468 domain-containing protein n=1 Tax=Rhodovibrio salinarum TaxID=1087 RepID=A0A934QE12_9PROT|nr:tripartite tricarboxylate transporter TctB family protein [Rhodovibrio salinarum]MBK1695641.1 hypothetical protein [Rhodovibrio salinarum]
MRIPINTDLATAVIGFTFAGVLWFGTSLPGRLSLIFPQAVLIIMCVLCTGLVIKGVAKPAEREVVIEGNPKRLFAMIAVLLIWWFGIRILGFIVATSIVFVSVTSYLAYAHGSLTRKMFATSLPIIAALITIFYLAFTYILNVDLPEGMFI